MKELDFKGWFKENATSTACVANFARPVGPMVRREFPKKKKKALEWVKYKEDQYSLGDNSEELAQQLGIDLNAVKLSYFKKTGNQMSPMEIEAYLKQVQNQKQIANSQQGYANQGANAVNNKDYF